MLKVDSVCQLFIDAYIEAALWSSHDDAGNFFDSVDEYQLSDECRATMTREAVAFYRQNCHMFKGNETQAGHDFWLTRNGHGAGFWDRQDLYVYKNDNGDMVDYATALTNSSKLAGERDLYAGEDNLIYQYPA